MGQWQYFCNSMSVLLGILHLDITASWRLFWCSDSDKSSRFIILLVAPIEWRSGKTQLDDITKLNSYKFGVKFSYIAFSLSLFNFQSVHTVFSAVLIYLKCLKFEIWIARCLRPTRFPKSAACQLCVKWHCALSLATVDYSIGLRKVRQKIGWPVAPIGMYMSNIPPIWFWRSLIRTDPFYISWGVRCGERNCFNVKKWQLSILLFVFDYHDSV